MNQQVNESIDLHSPRHPTILDNDSHRYYDTLMPATSKTMEAIVETGKTVYLKRPLS